MVMHLKLSDLCKHTDLSNQTQVWLTSYVKHDLTKHQIEQRIGKNVSSKRTDQELLKETRNYMHVAQYEDISSIVD